jgi:hypothetical protein
MKLKTQRTYHDVFLFNFFQFWFTDVCLLSRWRGWRAIADQSEQQFLIVTRRIVLKI